MEKCVEYAKLQKIKQEIIFHFWRHEITAFTYQQQPCLLSEDWPLWYSGLSSRQQEWPPSGWESHRHSHRQAPPLSALWCHQAADQVFSACRSVLSVRKPEIQLQLHYYDNLSLNFHLNRFIWSLYISIIFVVFNSNHRTLSSWGPEVDPSVQEKEKRLFLSGGR